MAKEVLIDGTMGILGRICSYAAKQALRGNNVIIFNCNDVIISGRKEDILARYKQKKARGGTGQSGPYFPRKTEDIVRRTIRGMIQYKKVMGAKAFRRTFCYPNTPEKYLISKKLSFKKDVPRYMKLSDLSRLM